MQHKSICFESGFSLMTSFKIFILLPPFLFVKLNMWLLYLCIYQKNTSELEKIWVFKVVEGLVSWGYNLRVCREGLSWGAGLRVLREGLNIINIIKNRVNQLLAGQSCFFFEVLLALLAFFSYDIFAEIGPMSRFSTS